MPNSAEKLSEVIPVFVKAVSDGLEGLDPGSEVLIRVEA